MYTLQTKKKLVIIETDDNPLPSPSHIKNIKGTTRDIERIVRNKILSHFNLLCIN